MRSSSSSGMGKTNRTFGQALLIKKYWWLHALIVTVISVIGLVALGVWTYTSAPPLTNYVLSSTGETVIPEWQIQRGKQVFHLKGLMTYGSFWGDGGERGPDFTAEALHHTYVSMSKFYENEIAKERPVTQADRDMISVRVKREIHENGYDAAANIIRINPAQVFAYQELITHYTRMFTDATYEEAFMKGRIENHISSPEDLKALAGYFFWGGWVSGANRPGFDYTYTHNWPPDPLVGNTPTFETYLWSFISIFVLFCGTMLVLYVYGEMKVLPGEPFNGRDWSLTTVDLENKGDAYVRPTQRATYKFFAFAVILFLVQVLAGILSAEDFVGGGPGSAIATTVLGFTIPFTVTRGWHTIVQIYWFFMAWVGYTLFFLPRISKVPNGQRFLINLLFTLCLIVGAGALFGIYLGHTGYMTDDMAYWFGSQGWEFLELGRFWHILMLASFCLWVYIIFRAVKPWITSQNLWSVPAWLFYGSGIMVLFLFFGMFMTPSQNFAIADYWRWMNIHMWVEVTFEVFTTCIVGYMLVQMGLVNRAMAERVIFLAVMMFLVTALIGISHNFYWIAKPTGIIALGSVFSTMQVLPLLLITLDAWKMRTERTKAHENIAEGKQRFVMDGVWTFILAVNFWNIFGAGVFGSLINLPIVNYYEHGTYLTGNHAHAAMFGVKGNIAIAGMLFACQHLFQRSAWNEKLIKGIFWSLQVGLVLMMMLDLFPVGLYQVATVFKEGLWAARAQAHVTDSVWITLTWMRTIGGAVFLFGGVLPLVYFILSRAGRMVREASVVEEGEWTIYDREKAKEREAWAAGDEAF
ncbi:putative Cytochrome c oxidase subunit I precursor; nitric oxide-like (norZ) [Candidatus Methylomirabilis oxygeniifera]|uniref:Putative Cytochrome c oxidase subunit I nitric oxide-like (NorZ) n=1 Tax=Methylomirabilis oxygeniifera TaxID=671143 RepID=D5MIY2_METO1|nr:putative Cytochrome c oxidase subunit I precursor; nitric oxide-like (norZ) [Candidatus Methylomirabilis oxyfera]